MSQTIRKYLKVIINLFLAMATFSLVIFIVPSILNYFMPFIVGAIIAAIANPLVRFFEEKMRIKRKAGTVVVIVLVIGAIILIGYLIISMLITETISFVNGLPKIWKSFEGDFATIQANWAIFLDKLPLNVQSSVNDIILQLTTYIGDLVSSIGTPTVNAVSNFAKHVPSTVIAILMCLLSSYFFIADRENITKAFHTYLPVSIQNKWNILKNCFTKAIGGYFKAQFKIEIWIYLLLVVGFAILQVDYLLLIALGIAFLDFLPFFGTGIIMLPWAVIKFLTGDYKMAIGLVIIWGVCLLIRQLIQPKIMGDSVGLPALPTLVLLFVGFKIGSVAGIILAVPVGIIVLNLIQAGMFETTTKSIEILVCGINNFRQLNDSDLAEVNRVKRRQKREKNGTASDERESDLYETSETGACEKPESEKYETKSN